MNLKLVVVLFLIYPSSSPHPIPQDSETTTTTESSYSPPSLIVVGDNLPSSESNGDDNEESQDKHKRHRPTPSPEELEERRKALIDALRGGSGDDDDGGGGGQIAASIMGLGSLATDVVSLLGSNANETFAPLREARQRARDNFPDFGTTLNAVLKNGREYARRAYKGIAKNGRVKLTNTLRFMLQAVTRLGSVIGGLYQVVISMLDVTTRGIGVGARVGSRLLAVGSNATVVGLARATGALRNLAQSGALVKPFNQAVTVGRGISKGLEEDFYDKFEWTQEGLNSKIELAQALAPNFLLRAHEKTTTTTSTPETISISDDGYNGGGDDKPGGYSKLTDNEDEMLLLSLASTAQEMMQRGGRNVDMSTLKTVDKGTTSASESLSSTMETSSMSSLVESPSSTTLASSSTDSGPPQALLNDIFGLQDEIKELKKDKNGTMETTTEESSTTSKS